MILLDHKSNEHFGNALDQCTLSLQHLSAFSDFWGIIKSYLQIPIRTYIYCLKILTFKWCMMKSSDFTCIHQIVGTIKWVYETLCAIWFHSHNSKNVKNTHEEVLLFVKLEAYDKKQVQQSGGSCENKPKKKRGGSQKIINFEHMLFWMVPIIIEVLHHSVDYS